MTVTIIYREDIQEKLDYFENVLEKYKVALRKHLKEKYSKLEKNYPGAAAAHCNDYFHSDQGIKTIEYQIRKIKDLSIPEDIIFDFDNE